MLIEIGFGRHRILPSPELPGQVLSVEANDPQVSDFLSAQSF